jgi:hypothetical protein
VIDFLVAGRDAVARAAPFALAFDPAARNQIGGRGVPLAVRDAGSGKDVGFGVPAGAGLQVVDDGVGRAGALVGSGFDGFEFLAFVARGYIKSE